MSLVFASVPTLRDIAAVLPATFVSFLASLIILRPSFSFPPIAGQRRGGDSQ